MLKASAWGQYSCMLDTLFSCLKFANVIRQNWCLGRPSAPVICHVLYVKVQTPQRQL